MSIIAGVDHIIVDATREVVILETVITLPEPQSCIARIDMYGTTPGVIYTAHVSIDNCPIVPISMVRAVKDTGMLQSAPFVVNPGETVSLHLLGGPNDSALPVSATIITISFNAAELADALSKVQVQPIQYVLGPCPQPVSTMPPTRGELVSNVPESCLQPVSTMPLAAPREPVSIPPVLQPVR
jgi:hypothetical protein